MNYLLAFALCLAGTVIAALQNSPNLYWLITSDINVALWLFVAWALDGKSRGG